MKRPVSMVGLAIMSAAVVVGFVPTIWSILLLFVTTLLGGHFIKKHAEESYDGFITMFGLMCAGANFLAAGMMMFATELEYVDRISGAFLSMMVGIVISTLLKIKNDGGKTKE